MQIPAVGFVEAAIDVLTARAADDTTLTREIHEFRMLGVARHNLLRHAAATRHYTDLERGYLLGLEVMRVLIGTNPAFAAAGDL